MRPATPSASPQDFTGGMPMRLLRLVSTITVSPSSGNRAYSVPVMPACVIMRWPRCALISQPNPCGYTFEPAPDPATRSADGGRLPMILT